MTKPMFRMPGATAAIAIAVALSGCGQQATDSQMTAASLPSLPATLPLAAGPATGWTIAPAAASLPASRPLRVANIANPGEYYGYADAAYDYQDVLGDAPPDYYFDYDGSNPWAWEGYDQSVVFVEPIDQGYRYYYYRPGAEVPYFVRDPNYGYGYDNGNLAVVYDDFGGVVPYADYGPRLGYASRYFARGTELFAASRQAPRRAVVAADWAARSAAIAGSQARWAALRERQPQWRDFHAQTAARDATYWREENVRRQADARRFADWRSQDFRTASPPRAIPAAWAKARWASDQARFLPARAERAQPAAVQPPRREAPLTAPANANPDQRRRDKAPAIVPVPPNGGRMVIEGNRGSPATGPMRAVREPQSGPAMVRIDRPQGERGNGRNRVQPIAQPQLQSPARARPDRGNAASVRPERAPEAIRPQPQPQAAAPQPARNAGGGNGGSNRGNGNGGGDHKHRHG